MFTVQTRQGLLCKTARLKGQTPGVRTAPLEWVSAPNLNVTPDSGSPVTNHAAHCSQTALRAVWFCSTLQILPQGQMRDN